MSDENEIELQLRLDVNGRTTYDPESANIKKIFVRKNNDDIDNKNENLEQLNFASKTVLTSLASKSCMNNKTIKLNENYSESEKGKNKSLKTETICLDELLFDCEISDCGLFPRTFWMPYGAEPRCALEKMASQIFHHHVPKYHIFDPTNSGAEWWVQIRPSPPKTGRYSLVHEMDKQTNENKDVHDDDPPKGISFHWDKDEELRLMTGGSMFIHPHISTVTYLTDLGAPTMVLDCQVASNTLSTSSSTPASDGLPDPSKHVESCFISWPKTGKHLSFDGRMLHAAPIDLMPEGEFQRQCQYQVAQNLSSTNKENTKSNTRTHTSLDGNNTKKEQRKKRRVTFLVNIWLNYRPFGVNPFPHGMIDKLCSVESLPDELFPSHTVSNMEPCDSVLRNKDDSLLNNNSPVSSHSFTSNTIVVSGNDVSHSNKTFIWPLGGNDSKEQIKVEIPLSLTQEQMKEGGNICIEWNNNKSAGGVSFITSIPNNQVNSNSNPNHDKINNECIKNGGNDKANEDCKNIEQNHTFYNNINIEELNSEDKTHSKRARLS